ncbi:MAG: LysR family transcriptional regulator [Ruminococcaceae bacterium]|nr:LysR family transcriptional regulator [Oscillospiraceae bacterium]
MDTFKVKAILAVAKYKNMSRAAEEFSYTPSAFSHMISGFEEELGVKLFERNSRGVELTDAGKSLMSEFEIMLACESKIQEKARRMAVNKGQEIRIATYSSLSRNFLPEIIKSFRKKYPEVIISVKVSDHISALLDDGSADVIFGSVTAFKGNDWFEIAEDEFLAVAPGGFFGERESIEREELYSMPQIYTDDEPLRNYFEVERFSELMYFRSEDDLSVIDMVKKGMGVTVLPSLVLKGNSDGVQAIRLIPALKRTLGVAFKRGKRQDVLVLFLDHVKKYRMK